jgi:hypothetical protein
MQFCKNKRRNEAFFTVVTNYFEFFHLKVYDYFKNIIGMSFLSVMHRVIKRFFEGYSIDLFNLKLVELRAVINNIIDLAPFKKYMTFLGGGGTGQCHQMTHGEERGSRDIL